MYFYWFPHVSKVPSLARNRLRPSMSPVECLLRYDVPMYPRYLPCEPLLPYLPHASSCSLSGLWRWTIQTQPSPTFTNSYPWTLLAYLTLPPYLHTNLYFYISLSQRPPALLVVTRQKYVSFFAACLLAVLSTFNQINWFSINSTPPMHLYPHGQLLTVPIAIVKSYLR